MKKKGLFINGGSPSELRMVYLCLFHGKAIYKWMTGNFYFWFNCHVPWDVLGNEVRHEDSQMHVNVE
jgi:hypothetical protein